MRRPFLSLSLILVLAFSAIAQQQRADEAAPSVERLRAHITYLASDKLEGRRTGSAGANMAAEYIAREFARYGLRRSIGRDLPGMSVLEADSPHRYMQEFPYVAGVELGKNNAMLFTPRSPNAAPQGSTSAAQTNARAASLDLRPGEDWLPLGFSTNASVLNAPATFVGYGLKVDEISYDDYAGAEVRDRIAIAFEGTPDGDNPHGHFAQYTDVRWKAIAAREHGAKALVVIAREENFKDDGLAQLRYDNSAGDAGLPVTVISRQAAARFFELDSLKFLDAFEKKLQEAILSTQRVSKSSGYDIKLHISPPLNFTLSLTTDITRRNTPAYNVVGILDGSDPVLKNEVIVIGAHYDHLGRGGEGSLAPREGDIHHGADDNASGVGGLLELARIFSADRKNLKRTLVFIAFSGEEEGLLGSDFYVKHPILPLDRTVAMINMDMIGRMKDNKLIIGGVGTAKEWRGLIDIANFKVPGQLVEAPAHPGDPPKPLKVPPEGISINASIMGKPDFTLTLNEDGYGPSDHSSFYVKKIPVLFLFTGTHDDYHKPSDTADKINYEDEARIISFVKRVVHNMDFNPQPPTYTVAKSESPGGAMSFRVYLGTIPNYSESTNGLTLDGVREDSPASKAGLKAGDRVVKLAGRDVRNVYDYTYALGEMKAGQVYDVEVVRGTETLKLKITPAARK